MITSLITINRKNTNLHEIKVWFVYIPYSFYFFRHPKNHQHLTKANKFHSVYYTNTHLHDSFFSLSLYAGILYLGMNVKKKLKKYEFFFSENKAYRKWKCAFNSIDCHTSHACCKIFFFLFFYQWNLSGGSIIAIINFPINVLYSFMWTNVRSLMNINWSFFISSVFIHAWQ